MKHVLLLGATGRLGKVVLECLLDKGYGVTVLVRTPEKITSKYVNIKILKGDVTSEDNVRQALDNVDAVISTLGHGFRTAYPIQGKTMSIIIPLLEENGIKRIVTITGAALKTKEDPPSVVLDVTEKLLGFIDPYRMQDARHQQDLLERSSLSWTVVRTPVHKSGNIVSGVAGYEQPLPWQRVTRKAVANFMIDCIEKSSWIRKSPIFY